MEFLSTTQMSEKWNISSRRIQILYSEGRIDGAIKVALAGLSRRTQRSQMMRESRVESMYEREDIEVELVCISESISVLNFYLPL